MEGGPDRAHVYDVGRNGLQKVLDQSVTSTVLSLTHTGDSAHTHTHMQNWAAGSFTHDARLAVSRLARSRAERGPRARAHGSAGRKKGIVLAVGKPVSASCTTYAKIAIIAMRPFQISPSWSEKNCSVPGSAMRAVP